MTGRSSPWLSLVCTLPVLAALACGGGGGGTQPPPVDNDVARIDVAPLAPLNLVSGTTATLSATAFNRSGRSLGSASLTWSSSEQNVASVVNGVVTSRLVGSAVITATGGAISSAGVTVTVTAGAAAQLALRTQPAGAASATVLATQPVVEVRDAAGNLVTGSTVSVTAALTSGGGTLTGTTTVAAAGGIATFAGLSVTGLLGARTLSFTAAGLTPATSSPFQLAAGVATQLAIRVQPVAGTAYASFTTPPAVELRDAQGNLTGSTAAVTAALASGGGTLGGAVTATAAAGVATFTTLTVNGVAGARTLSFTSGSLQAVTSASFTVADAPPAVIAFVPAAATINSSIGNNALPVDVQVTNTGVFPLTNLRVQGIVYGTGAAGWLTATFPSGANAPATLRLTAAAAPLAMGSFTATVTLAGDGAGATSNLAVTLTVTVPTVNTYGTPLNKVSLLSTGALFTPGLVTTSGQTGLVVPTDPAVTYTARSPTVATVDATGRITGGGRGQSWVVASSTQSAADSVLVIVPRATGPVLRTNLTNYRSRVGDTLAVSVLLDARGTAVGAITATISWPPFIGNGAMTSSLALIDVSTAGSALAPTAVFDPALNLIRLTGAATSAGNTGLISLMVVRFRIVSAGVNVLYLSATELLGADLSNLLPNTTITQYPVIVP